MAVAVIIFEREGVDGLVAVGSILCDAAKQFGIRLGENCVPQSGEHHCSLIITEGEASLSPLSAFEMEHFAAVRRKNGERLACEARITAAGDITIMTAEKKKATEDAPKKAKIVEEFESLPLEQKLANLFRMEAVALGETIEYVVNSPMKVFEKIGDIMADFGRKIESEAKKASRPAAAGPTVDRPEDKKAATGTRRKTTVRPKRTAAKD